MNVPNANLDALNKNAGKFPAPFAFVFAIVAAVVATVFDYVFEAIIHLGGYIWYAATAICFIGAGFGAGLMTKAGKMGSYVAIGVGAGAYAVLTIVLTVVVFGDSVGDAIVPAAINVAIALATGIGAATKGNSQREAAAAPKTA